MSWSEKEESGNHSDALFVKTQSKHTENITTIHSKQPTSNAMNQTSSSVQSPESEDPEYDEAQKRVRKIKKFYKELAGWAGTSVILLGLDLFLSGGITWSKFPVFFYGLFVVGQVFDIIRLQRLDKDWEDRQMRRFTGRATPKRLQSTPVDGDTNSSEDYTGELLNREEREVADLTEYRKMQKPWKEDDLV